jgi:hypothetical protein
MGQIIIKLICPIENFDDVLFQYSSIEITICYSKKKIEINLQLNSLSTNLSRGLELSTLWMRQ